MVPLGLVVDVARQQRAELVAEGLGSGIDCFLGGVGRGEMGCPVGDRSANPVPYDLVGRIGEHLRVGSQRCLVVGEGGLVGLIGHRI